LAIYPEVAIRKLHGVDTLLTSILKRYTLYYDHHSKLNTSDTSSNNQTFASWNVQLYVPPSTEFDSAFHSIIRRFQDSLSTSNTSSNSLEKLNSKNNKSNNNNNKQQKNKGKEQRVWHDGKQKITKAALAELDMSKDKSNTGSANDKDGIREDKRAIAEAKAAYMPEANEKPSSAAFDMAALATDDGSLAYP